MDPKLSFIAVRRVTRTRSATEAKVCPTKNQLCSPNVFQVRRITRTRFAKQKFAQLRTGPNGYLSNCDEAMFGVQSASLKMLWEYSPNPASLASFMKQNLASLVPAQVTITPNCSRKSGASQPAPTCFPQGPRHCATCSPRARCSLAEKYS